VSDGERNQGPFDALSPARWAVVIGLGAIAVGTLLAPGQWLVEGAGLSPLVGIGLVLAIETVAAIGIATAVLWESDTTESTLDREREWE
jgi:hypothetical protein